MEAIHLYQWFARSARVTLGLPYDRLHDLFLYCSFLLELTAVFFPSILFDITLPMPIDPIDIMPIAKSS